MEFWVHCVASLLSVKTWMEGTRDMPYKNPISLGVNKIGWDFAEMQKISYSFINPIKSIQMNNFESY